MSVVTFCKSLVTDWRTGKANRRAAFEANYGTPLRTGLRSFEQKLGTLRAFTLMNPKPLAEQQEEFEKLRGGWLDAHLEVFNLLQEIDASPSCRDRIWVSYFGEQGREAEEHLLAATEPTLVSDIELRTHADAALGAYRKGIQHVREMLTEQIKR